MYGSITHVHLYNIRWLIVDNLQLHVNPRISRTNQINSFNRVWFNIRSNPSEWPIICSSSWMCSHQFIPLKSQIIHIWKFHTLPCCIYCMCYMSYQKWSWMRIALADDRECESDLQTLLIFNAIGFHKNNMSNKCFMCTWNGGFCAMKGRCSFCVDVWIADDELLHMVLIRIYQSASGSYTAAQHISEQFVQIRVKMVNIHWGGVGYYTSCERWRQREFSSQSAHKWKCSSGFVLCVKVIFAKDKLATCCTQHSTYIAASQQLISFTSISNSSNNNLPAKW